MSKKSKENIVIYGQAQGLRNLPIEGGWRLQIDMFDARIEDVQIMAEIVNRKANMKLTIEVEN